LSQLPVNLIVLINTHSFKKEAVSWTGQAFPQPVKTQIPRAAGVAQVIKVLSKHKALSSKPSTANKKKRKREKKTQLPGEAFK
jgi:hypothetical protein